MNKLADLEGDLAEWEIVERGARMSDGRALIRRVGAGDRDGCLVLEDRC